MIPKPHSKGNLHSSLFIDFHYFLHVFPIHRIHIRESWARVQTLSTSRENDPTWIHTTISSSQLLQLMFDVPFSELVPSALLRILYSRCGKLIRDYYLRILSSSHSLLFSVPQLFFFCYYLQRTLPYVAYSITI